MNKLTGSLGALLLAVAAPLAHAGLEITYSINGGAPVVCGPAANPNPAALCGNVAGPTFDITFLGATSNAPGGTPSQEESATVDLSNATSSTQKITINVISTGFTTPVTPPSLDLLSHIGGTVVTGAAANLLSFVSCVDATNSQTAGCPATDNAPTLTPSIVSAGSYSADSSVGIASLGSPYAIDEALAITLGAHSNVNFSASTTLVTTVPEPMSIVLLGSVALLTSGLIRRRRKGASQV